MNNSDAKVGLGVVALMAMCCGGPLILSLLASGAMLGGLSAVWADGRLLVVPGVVLVVGAMWLLSRRRSSHANESSACSATPVPTASTHRPAPSAGPIEPDDRERTPASTSSRSPD
jgi:hypothetical protein